MFRVTHVPLGVYAQHMPQVPSVPYAQTLCHVSVPVCVAGSMRRWEGVGKKEVGIPRL